MAYATYEQFQQWGLPCKAIDDPVPVEAALGSASRTIDGYLSTRYAVPLTQYPEDVSECCCKIAAWEYLSGNRGRQPDGPDEVVRIRRDDAMRWLRDVQSGKASIIGVPGVSDPLPGAPTALTFESDTPRGW